MDGDALFCHEVPLDFDLLADVAVVRAVVVKVAGYGGGKRRCTPGKRRCTLGKKVSTMAWCHTPPPRAPASSPPRLHRKVSTDSQEREHENDVERFGHMIPSPIVIEHAPDGGADKYSDDDWEWEPFEFDRVLSQVGGT